MCIALSSFQDCCSELEALGAGAPHVHTRQEKEEQIERDVSRTSYTIGSITVGPASGQNIQDNIQQKLVQKVFVCLCMCVREKRGRGREREGERERERGREEEREKGREKGRERGEKRERETSTHQG